MRFVVVTLMLTACTPLAAPLAPRAPPIPLAPLAACAPQSSGALTIEGPESALGYDDELAALDLFSLPPSISLAALADSDRELVRYMLEEAALDNVDRDRALQTSLGRAVLAAFAGGANGALDVDLLRRGLHRFYACQRGFPLTLASFNETIADIGAMVVGETVDSRVKGLPRRMRRSVVDGMFVAETLVTTGGIQTVRETEILLTDRRTDGAIEFIEYDAAGALRGASSFAFEAGAQSVGAVPFACIGCHGTRDVTPLVP